MFKKGDKVKCINRLNLTDESGNIKIGEIYTINRANMQIGWVELKEKTGIWTDTQFEFVENYKKEIKMLGIAKFCNQYYK
jgi:Holliday junction resolvase-like predicted endonuclease